ncbi:MAG TPA: hypothetical protein PLQ68_07925 [Clostridia bacterium]|nr:hypothetical protein [Clostridia bacterium]
MKPPLTRKQMELKAEQAGRRHAQNPKNTIRGCPFMQKTLFALLWKQGFTEFREAKLLAEKEVKEGEKECVNNTEK